MNAVIDMPSELLIDRSRVREPHVRLLLKAVGRELARGSAWVVVNKEIATHYGLARQFLLPQQSVANSAYAA